MHRRLHELQAVSVLVIGDFMLDVYTEGTISRLSPEAPVPILHVDVEEKLPGGAGNVVVNLKALGAHPIPVGCVGDDDGGREIIAQFLQDQIDVEGLVIDSRKREGFLRTPVKTRMMAQGQQLIRIDRENKRSFLSEQLERDLLQVIQKKLPSSQIVILSDYAKGTLSSSLIKHAISLANQKGIPVLVDPKGEEFGKYIGATLLTPNEKEAYAASHLPSHSSLSEVGELLLSKTKASYIVITRSEHGMTLFRREKSPIDLPAKAREVKDVTGAGDTALAMTAVAWASGIDLPEALQLANIAAGLAVEKLGCAQISLVEMMNRILSQHPSGKIFTQTDLPLLEKLLQKKKVAIACLSHRQELSLLFLDSLRRIPKEMSVDTLILYIPDGMQEDPLVSLLASLHEVNFILLKIENLSAFCLKIGGKLLEVDVAPLNSYKSGSLHAISAAEF